MNKMDAQDTQVLLVEDVSGDAYLVRRLLEATPGACFTVDVVSCAADAVTLIDMGGVDIVLLDLDLPDSTKFDTVLQFRTLFPSLPVVVLTRIEDLAIGLQAIECGAQDYVPKGLMAGGMLVRAVRFAIARQNQIRSYKAEAHTDALTGLSNRRAFDVELSRYLAEWTCQQRPMSLLILDVDRFKRLNDTFGHRTGDCVLSSLGTVLSGSIRPTDFPARFGGEEFAVILPDTRREEAAGVIRRVLEAVANQVFHFEGHQLRITASVGGAVTQNGDDADLLLERADSALYVAKSAGRDCGYFSDGKQYYTVPSGVEVDV